MDPVEDDLNRQGSLLKRKRGLDEDTHDRLSLGRDRNHRCALEAGGSSARPGFEIPHTCQSWATPGSRPLQENFGLACSGHTDAHDTRQSPVRQVEDITSQDSGPAKAAWLCAAANTGDTAQYGSLHRDTSLPNANAGASSVGRGTTNTRQQQGLQRSGLYSRSSPGQYAVLQAERAVEYAAVWKNTADPFCQEKSYIVSYPKGNNTWYILRCGEHSLYFNQDPFLGAICHLSGPDHRLTLVTHDVAVKELGWRVRGCDFQLATINNKRYMQELRIGRFHPSSPPPTSESFVAPASVPAVTPAPASAPEPSPAAEAVDSLSTPAAEPSSTPAVEPSPSREAETLSIPVVHSSPGTEIELFSTPAAEPSRVREVEPSPAPAVAPSPVHIIESVEDDEGGGVAEAPKSAQKRPKRQRPFLGINDPVVGEIYQSAWREDRHLITWNLVAVLPLYDWSEVGIHAYLPDTLLALPPHLHAKRCLEIQKRAEQAARTRFEADESIQTPTKAAKAQKKAAPRKTGKRNTIPKCYATENGVITGWAEGFEDGGPRVNDRQFPCLFLHSTLAIPPAHEVFNLPSDPVLAWVLARNLRARDFIHPPEVDLSGFSSDVARKFKERADLYMAVHNSPGSPRFKSPYALEKTTDYEVHTPQSRELTEENDRDRRLSSLTQHTPKLVDGEATDPATAASSRSSSRSATPDEISQGRARDDTEFDVSMPDAPATAPYADNRSRRASPVYTITSQGRDPSSVGPPRSMSSGSSHTTFQGSIDRRSPSQSDEIEVHTAAAPESPASRLSDNSHASFRGSLDRSDVEVPGVRAPRSPTPGLSDYLYDGSHGDINCKSPDQPDRIGARQETAPESSRSGLNRDPDASPENLIKAKSSDQPDEIEDQPGSVAPLDYASLVLQRPFTKDMARAIDYRASLIYHGDSIEDPIPLSPDSETSSQCKEEHPRDADFVMAVTPPRPVESGDRASPRNTATASVDTDFQTASPALCPDADPASGTTASGACAALTRQQQGSAPSINVITPPTPIGPPVEALEPPFITPSSSIVSGSGLDNRCLSPNSHVVKEREVKPPRSPLPRSPTPGHQGGPPELRRVQPSDHPPPIPPRPSWLTSGPRTDRPGLSLETPVVRSAPQSYVTNFHHSRYYNHGHQGRLREPLQWQDTAFTDDIKNNDKNGH